MVSDAEAGCVALLGSSADILEPCVGNGGGTGSGGGTGNGGGTGSGGGTAISEPCLSNGGGIGMVCGHGFGFGREGVGAGCTALLGCSAFTCGRGCVAVEALWLNASLDDEECVLETMRVGFG